MNVTAATVVIVIVDFISLDLFLNAIYVSTGFYVMIIPSLLIRVTVKMLTGDVLSNTYIMGSAVKECWYIVKASRC